MGAGRTLGVTAVFVLAAALSASSAVPSTVEGWRAIAWPFPRDAWPSGLAFECGRATCGTELRLYVRPKRGFCANCESGVTSDAEVDGVADLDMIATDFAPLGPGDALAAGDLAGRQRAYTLSLPSGGHSTALGIAMTRRKQCDLVVAVADGAANDQAKRAIVTLLESDRVVPWIDRALDGR